MLSNVKHYTVANKSKEQAQSYCQSGNYGRAFAHFLVALKLNPGWKDDLKADFSSTLCTWGKQLETQQRFQDLFNCYEQALEIFPENEEVLSNLGAHLFRLGHLREAAHYFRQALKVNSDYLPAYRNLQSVCNSLVERWHFRMLNDSHRNEAYREAIFKKIRQGFKSVLDIGSGTGILSLYAVTSGAKDVHACDYSPTMCAIARDVLEANHVTDKVTVINKLSNNLTFPEDLLHRKSLVVTETMDAGLLGEHLLQTLIHAWDELLKPPCPQLLNALDSEEPMTQYGVVLPFGAKLWAVPVHCPSVARRNYLTNIDKSVWSFKSVWLYSDLPEPYDTENLRNVKDCTFLCDAKELFTFDFNNPAQLQSYHRGDKDGLLVSFQFEGKADFLAVWFDVMLDEDITISSSPFAEDKNCCWDQAIFRFHKPLSFVKAKVGCGGGKLKFDFVTEDLENTTSTSDRLTSLQSRFGSANIISEIPVCSEMISFLNNKELQDSLVSLSLSETFNSVKHVLDLTPFPTVGLSFLQRKSASLVCAVKSEQEVLGIKEIMKDNKLEFSKVKCIMKNELDKILASGCEKFDLIVLNLFDPKGELRETSINSIPSIMKMLSPGGVIAPTTVTVMCQLIDSEWISQTSRVVNEELTEAFKIAEFINIYQVSQQLDIDLKNISFTPLSEATKCLQLAVSDLVVDSSLTRDLQLSVVQDGHVNGISLWYQYQLCPGGEQLSTFTEDSHVNQMVYLLDHPLMVKPGEAVDVNVTYRCGVIRLKVKS